MFFNAMVWTTHLCGHLSRQAHTYLHGQCIVDGCLGKRGYESTPVCAKPSYWMYLERVNSSMNSRGNGRPTVDRFDLTKCHLWMNYILWF